MDNKLNQLYKKALITGGGGFIGSHLVDALLAEGLEVVCVDNYITGNPDNVAHNKNNPNFVECVCDITNYRDMQACFDGVDLVFHQAALGSIPRSIKDPLNTHSNNVNGFANVIELAMRNNVKKFIYASSSSVYGDDKTLPKTEDVIGTPLAPYGLSKLANELYAKVFSRTYGMDCIGLRYFNVFGPRQNPLGEYSAVIPRWISQLKNREAVEIFGDGTTSRDFTYVKNVVQANILAAELPFSEGRHEVFNIACGKITSLRELFEILVSIISPGKKYEPVYQDFRKGDIHCSVASIEKAINIMGYHPTIELQSGLHLTAEE